MCSHDRAGRSSSSWACGSWPGSRPRSAPPAHPAALASAVTAAATYDWIVLTSANGVQTFFERFDADRRDVRELADVRLAAIGPETAAQLHRRLVRPAVVPGDFRAEGLL